MSRVVTSPSHPPSPAASSVEMRSSKPPLFLRCFSFVPMVAMAQGSPFDTGFNAIQSLFNWHDREGCKSGCIVIGGYGLRARGTRCEKGARRRCRRNGASPFLAVNVLSWLWGV